MTDIVQQLREMVEALRGLATDPLEYQVHGTKITMWPVPDTDVKLIAAKNALANSDTLIAEMELILKTNASMGERLQQFFKALTEPPSDDVVEAVAEVLHNRSMGVSICGQPRWDMRGEDGVKNGVRDEVKVAITAFQKYLMENK